MGKYGLIYIAHNPRDGKDTFKVGKTERDIAGRMAELTASTSNLGQYSSLAYFVVSDIHAAERACHLRLAQYRIQENREFFEIEINLLLRVVQEQVSPYLAQSLAPEIPEMPEEEPLDPTTLSERIKKKRDRVQMEAETKKAQEEEAKESATKLFHEWTTELTEKMEKVKREFAGVPFIRWMKADPEGSPKNYTFIKLRLYADTQDQPARLLFRGYESWFLTEDRKGATVLARSSSSNDKRGPLMVWEEDDDHRVAQIEVHVKLDSQPWKTIVNVFGRAISYYPSACVWTDWSAGGAGLLYNVDEAIDCLVAILANYSVNPIRVARKITGPATKRGPSPDKFWGPEIQQQVFRCPRLNSR